MQMNIFPYKLLTNMIFLNYIHSSFMDMFPPVNARRKIKVDGDGDAGNPLFISPYLEKNQITLAQNLSRVSITERMGITSHAGFFTVDPKHNSNLYFWYFPPFSKNEEVPVILWLQGGPGESSLVGLFTENGPLMVTNKKFTTRKFHWALNNHLLYIDNPVGTGFSFTDDDQGYCNDQNCVAKGLYNCLQQFFKLFPYLRNNIFFITGESYAGKYIPPLAMEIHKQNENQMKINLYGLAIGNPFCDPVNQINYAPYLYQLGLIDDNQKKGFSRAQAKVIREIHDKNWAQASKLLDQLVIGIFSNLTYFKKYTGIGNFLDYTDSKGLDINMYRYVFNDVKVRRSVHVGGLPFYSDLGNSTTEVHLFSDTPKSVAPLISDLLSHYRLMFYSGQLDVVSPYPLMVNFLRKLNFTSSEDYKRAPRHIWKVGSDIAGYYKKAGNLTEVLVRNAGHLVPLYQPKWAYDLITKYVNNQF